MKESIIKIRNETKLTKLFIVFMLKHNAFTAYIVEMFKSSYYESLFYGSGNHMNLIGSYFAWEFTNKGHDYWRDLHFEWQDYLNQRNLKYLALHTKITYVSQSLFNEIPIKLLLKDFATYNKLIENSMYPILKNIWNHAFTFDDLLKRKWYKTIIRLSTKDFEIQKSWMNLILALEKY